MLTIALLAHVSFLNILLTPPILLLLTSQPESFLASPRPFKGDYRKGLRLISEFAVYFVALFFIASIASGGSTWVARTWGARYVDFEPVKRMMR